MEEEHDVNHPTKDLSVLKSSPGTFTKEFLQSYQQVKYKNHSDDLVSDLDDDDERDEIEQRNRNYNYQNENKEKYQSDALSTSTTSSNQHEYLTHNHHQHESSFSDEVNQARISSSATPSSTSTITSNFAAKLDTRKSMRISSL